MGNTVQTATIDPVKVVENKETGEKPKCKACCACPETKKARDEW